MSNVIFKLRETKFKETIHEITQTPECQIQEIIEDEFETYYKAFYTFQARERKLQHKTEGEFTRLEFLIIYKDGGHPIEIVKSFTNRETLVEELCKKIYH